MSNFKFSRLWWRAGLCITLFVLGACNLPEPPKTNNAIPAEYANTHMPKGWWNDDAIIEEGRQLYLGIKKGNVNCAKCHGKTGKPVKSGARDFRDTSTMKKYSDSHLVWRISEGLPFTKMRAYKDKLSGDDIWKIIAFTRTFGLSGLQYDPIRKDWVSTPTSEPS